MKDLATRSAAGPWNWWTGSGNGSHATTWCYVELAEPL